MADSDAACHPIIYVRGQPLTPKKLKGDKVQLTIPFDSETTPGISGQLRCVVSAWNDE